jgi:3-hydroxymyristoyl/3-hydroxydecanoyl-(acyl carrier protein) dehydratase
MDQIKMNFINLISENILNHSDIKNILPHRFPFLFVEEAKVISDSEVTGFMVWSTNHPILQGHFPKLPIVPGVCQIEALAQLAGIFVQITRNYKLTEKIGVLASIRSSKFNRRLLADERFEMKAQIREIQTDLYLIKATGEVNQILVCVAEFIVASVYRIEGD